MIQKFPRLALMQAVKLVVQDSPVVIGSAVPDFLHQVQVLAGGEVGLDFHVNEPGEQFIHRFVTEGAVLVQVISGLQRSVSGLQT